MSDFFAELIKEKPGTQTVEIARSEFLRTIQRIAPEVLEDLRRGPYALYQELHDQLRNEGGAWFANWSQEEWLALLEYRLSLSKSQQSKPNELFDKLDAIESRISERILEWALSYNMADEWCIDRAGQTISMWYFSLGLPYSNEQNQNAEQGWYDNLRLEISPYNRNDDEDDPLLPTPPKGLPIYRPDEISRKGFLDAVEEMSRNYMSKSQILSVAEKSQREGYIEQILREVTEYCVNVEKYRISQGWARVATRPEFSRHLEWAVQFQVQGRSYSDIAEESGVTISTVTRAVENILKLIDLPKRPVPRTGRPVGSKDSVMSDRQIIKRRRS